MYLSRILLNEFAWKLVNNKLVNNKQHGVCTGEDANWNFLSIIQHLPEVASQSTMDWISSDIIKIRKKIAFCY